MTSRNTIQKQLIQDSLRRLDHPTAEQIWHDVASKVPTVSKATVYRNLKQMVEDKRAKLISIGSDPARYDHITENHAHFYCKTCGKTYDLPELQIDPASIQDEVEGFEVEDSELLLSGICSACMIK